MDMEAAVADRLNEAPALGLRLRSRLLRRRLDREIAAGAPIDESPDRALRARELTSPRERRALAAALANILDAAEERQIDACCPVAIEHAAVIAAREDIVELIALLRSAAALEPRAIARARCSRTTGGSARSSPPTRLLRSTTRLRRSV
jgi:hypothetical protein